MMRKSSGILHTRTFSIFIKKLLTNDLTCCIINFVRNEYVSVAQLDRASDYGSEGRVFESCHSRLNRKPMVCGFCFTAEKAKGKIMSTTKSYEYSLLCKLSLAAKPPMDAVLRMMAFFSIRKGGISAAFIFVGK